jgi:hypothetical protein
MSRKYVGQINSKNFVYPNQNLAEYDVEIIHDINNNCVSGTITGLTVSSTSTTSISFTHNGTFLMNGAQPFITTFSSPNYTLQYLSVHCQVPNQTYMNTWKVVDILNTTTSTPSTYTGNTITGNVITITPSMFGLSVFTSGTYYLEFRFIGQNCISKVCSSVNIVMPSPTPTPTVTPTNTATPTLTPTPTPTRQPVGQCYCFPVVVTGTTQPPPEGGVIATLDYNDCFGVRTSRAFLVGPGTYYQCIQVSSSVVQWFEGTNGIDTSYLTLTYMTGNCNTGYSCTGYDPAVSPTPTPTPTGTPGASPSPTPTGTPTPTPTNTVTPTPTGTPSTLSYSNTRFFFGNTTGDCCIAVASAGFYVPNVADPILGVPQYIYQNAGGTIPFPYPYVNDNVIGYPSATYNYNSSTGQVGSYVTSCL